MADAQARSPVVCGVAAWMAGVAALMALVACKPAHDSASTSSSASNPAGTATAGQEPPAAGATAPAAANIEPGHDTATKACLAAVAKRTNVEESRLNVTEVLWGEAGVGVTIEVPDAEAPWSCLADDEGNVQGTTYTGSEGAL